MANMLGGNVTYENAVSESVWSTLAPDMKKWFYEHGVRPVHSEHLFPNKAGLLTTYGSFPDEAEAQYAKYGLPADTQHALGHELYRTPLFTHFGITEAGVAPEKTTTALGVTHEGQRASSQPDIGYGLMAQASPKIEEYLHYLDDVMGDTSAMEWKEENFQSDSLSEIMSEHMNQAWAERGGDKDELLESWMNDPRTSHLEIEDAPDWSHHGNKINPRLGMGKFLVESMTNENYRNWADQQADLGYWHNPNEVYANAARPLVRYAGIDEFRKERGGGFGDLRIGGLDRELAHSLGVYLNARAREPSGMLSTR